MEGVIPRPDVGPILEEHFVAVAADADSAEPAVMDLALKLEGAMMLPFILFTDADGNFLDGYSGAVTPPYLRKTLGKLTKASA